MMHFDKPQLLEDQREYYVLRGMLRDFAKVIGVRNLQRTLADVDKQMAGRDNEDLPGAFQACIGRDLGVFFELTTKNIGLSTLLNREAVAKTPFWRALGFTLTRAAKARESGLLLFKCKHLGLYVAHNQNIMRSGPCIVIPPKTDGLPEITIEPLNQWAERANQ